MHKLRVQWEQLHQYLALTYYAFEKKLVVVGAVRMAKETVRKKNEEEEEQEKEKVMVRRKKEVSMVKLEHDTAG